MYDNEFFEEWERENEEAEFYRRPLDERDEYYPEDDDERGAE